MSLTQINHCLKELELANGYFITAYLLSRKQRDVSIKQMEDLGFLISEEVTQFTSTEEENCLVSQLLQVPPPGLSFNQRLQLACELTRTNEKTVLAESSIEAQFQSELDKLYEDFVFRPLADQPPLGTLLDVRLQAVKAQCENLRQQISAIPRLGLEQQEALTKYQILALELTSLQKAQFQTEKDLSEDRRISMVYRVRAFNTQEKNRINLQIAAAESRRRVGELEIKRIDVNQAVLKLEFALSQLDSVRRELLFNSILLN
jgi:hypothetical protein